MKREFQQKRLKKKAGRSQRRWIAGYVRGGAWRRRRKILIRAGAGIFFAGWIGLWLYSGIRKEVTETKNYLLPGEQQEGFYAGEGIECFGVQIRIHEGNITFFREKREAEMEEY